MRTLPMACRAGNQVLRTPGMRKSHGMAAHRLPSTTALQCFEAAERLGSFTAAAKELHLTQAAVSRQIITLEARLQVRLFERRREALRLTDAGRAYLDEVRPALQRLERATAGAMAHQGRGGRLVLSVASSLATYWLIPRLPSFTRAHPEVTLDITTRVGPADFGGGNGAAIDASLEFSNGERPGLTAEFVLPLELSPYAAPAWVRERGRRLGAETPASALIQHATVPEAWAGWCAAAGVSLAPDARSPRHDLMSMVLHAAQAGLGVALLPPFMVADALAARRLVRLSARRWRAARGYWLVMPEVQAERFPVVTFRRWLRDEAAKGLAAT